MKGSIAVSCPNTPERGRFFCKDHNSESVSRPFNVEDKVTYLKVNEIKVAKIKFIQKNSPYTIHDCFVNQDNELLFLAIGEKKEIFWINESDVSKTCMNEFLNIYDKRKDHIMLSYTRCMVRKEHTIPCMKKTRTTGVVLAVYNCGIICGFGEIFSHESPTQITSFLLDLIENLTDCSKFFIYDNACHLKAYINKSMNSSTDRARKLQQVRFVIDRLHIKNHVDANCHKNYNADLEPELLEINTVVCEETNFWLSRFKYIMKHMNSQRFYFFLYIVINSYNEQKLKQNKINFFNK